VDIGPIYRSQNYRLIAFIARLFAYLIACLIDRLSYCSLPLLAFYVRLIHFARLFFLIAFIARLFFLIAFIARSLLARFVR
jgi:hypothetical protein